MFYKKAYLNMEENFPNSPIPNSLSQIFFTWLSLWSLGARRSLRSNWAGHTLEST